MRRPAQSAPSPLPARAIERGWLEYADVVGRAASVATTPDAVLTLLRLAFFGGAAHALGELQARCENVWPRTVEALASEMLDDADRLVLEAARSERTL